MPLLSVVEQKKNVLKEFEVGQKLFEDAFNALEELERNLDILVETTGFINRQLGLGVGEIDKKLSLPRHVQVCLNAVRRLKKAEEEAKEHERDGGGVGFEESCGGF